MDIAIHVLDRKSLLKDITTLIAQEGIHINAIASRTDDGRGLADLRLTLKVSDFGQLSKLLARLTAVPGVSRCRGGGPVGRGGRGAGPW